VTKTELDWSHSEKVRKQYQKAVLKVESSGSLRQGTSKEHVEENFGEGDRKTDNYLERHAEESSRMCSVAR